MNPGEVRKLLGGYAAGTLTEEERRALFEAALTDQELFNELAREQALKELLDEPGARRQLLAALEAKESWVERIRGWLGRAVACAALGRLAVAVVLVVVVVQRTEKHATVLVAQGGRPAQQEAVETAPAVVTPVPAPARAKKQAVTGARIIVRQDKEELQDRRLEPTIGEEAKAKAADDKLEVAAAREAQPPVVTEPKPPAVPEPRPSVGVVRGGRGGGAGGGAAAPTAFASAGAARADSAALPSPSAPAGALSNAEVTPAAAPAAVTEQVTVTAEAAKVETEAGQAVSAADLQSAFGVRKDASQAMFLRSLENSPVVSGAAQAEQARAAVPYKILGPDAKGAYAEVPAQTVFRAADRVRVLFTAAQEGHLTVTAAGRPKPLLDRDVKAGASNRINVPSGVEKLVVTFTPRTARQRDTAAAKVAQPAPLSYEIPIQREPSAN